MSAIVRSWPEPARPRHAAPPEPVTPLDIMLLKILFGSDLRPTARGRWVACLALVLGAFIFVLVLAWLLGATADTIVDPTPELPADEGIQT